MTVKRFNYKEKQLGKFAEGFDVEIIKDFKKGFRLVGLTRGNFSLIEIIEALCTKIIKPDLTVCSWSIGIKDIVKIGDWLETKKISSFNMITDHSYTTRHPKYVSEISNILKLENIRTSEVHAKFVLIKNHEFNCVIISSMNLNLNRTCEIFEIEEDKDLYDLLDDYVKHTFKDMPTGFTADGCAVNRSLDAFFSEGVLQKTEFDFDNINEINFDI